MIRLIQRRLIIPRGDTGTFTLPALISLDSNTDVVTFVIFNQQTNSIIFEKQCLIDSEDQITVDLTYNDTVKLCPGIYVWDIKIYKNPQYEDNQLITSEEVHSYYASYRLPRCEIRETGIQDSLK